MKKALRILAILVFVMVFAAGCASFQKAASQVTPEQQTQMQANLAPVAPFIPQPYQGPAMVLVGWLACVGYNWFKEKTKKT